MLPVLATPRLALRPVADCDLDAVWRLLTDADVRRYLCDDKLFDRATVAGIIADCMAHAPAGMGMWVALHDGGFAGIVALKPVIPDMVDCAPHLRGEVEPTIALSPELWGKGLAGEALGAVLRHGFETLDFPRIAAVCDVPNLASARMLGRAGFRGTGEYPGVYYRILTWMLDRPN